MPSASARACTSTHPCRGRTRRAHAAGVRLVCQVGVSHRFALCVLHRDGWTRDAWRACLCFTGPSALHRFQGVAGVGVLSCDLRTWGVLYFSDVSGVPVGYMTRC